MAADCQAQAHPSLPAPGAPTVVYPLSQVHAGLHGAALTVFEGTQPESMDVEILGTLKNALGPGQDLILARLQGSKPEHTGVVAGMSGSPVYIDGKLVGALSYRIGQFSKEPIAGITPIEQMLEAGRQGDDAPAPARSGMGAAGQAEGVAAAADILPIETPLSFSGFGPAALRFFAERVQLPGMRSFGAFSSAVGGADLEAGSASGGGHPAAQGPLVPGSAVSALLVKGDMEIAATCTVTYIDSSRVLACGHPITRYGSVSMPMTKAEVVATLASSSNSFKIVNTTETVGAFTEDRESAISGRQGVTARMIPVTIHLRDGAAGPLPAGALPPGSVRPVSLSGGGDRVLHLEIVDNPEITPGALMVSFYQSLMETNSYGEDLTYAVRGDVAIDGYPTLRLNSFSAPTDQLPSAIQAALSVGQRFEEIYASSARLEGVRKVDLEVEALRGRLSTELESAQISQPFARAGETVMVEAALRPFHGVVKNLRIPITLPATLSPGNLRILLSDGATLDRLTNSYPGMEAPAGLSALIRQLNERHADDRLYVTLLLPEAQAVVDGRVLPSIPISMANVLEPLRTNRGMMLNGESVVPVTSIPVQATLAGQQIVNLTVE